MCRTSIVKHHQDRAVIEVMLAARVPLRVITERFGVKPSSASRHRVWLRQHDRATWRALRRIVRERGITKRSFLTSTHEGKH